MAGWKAIIASLQEAGIGDWAIVSRENGAVLAISPGFALGSYALDLPDETETTTERMEIHEVARLLHAIGHEGTSPDDHGIYIGQKKYYPTLNDLEKHSIYYKSKDGYACIAYTDRNFVLGTWVNLPPGPCIARVELIAGRMAQASF